MVTAEKVWEALAELPDPEIPVISLVDLGVVREVEVEGERVRVEFTPTFLGCPAQEVMRDQMADGRARPRRRARDRRRPRRLLVDRPHHAGGPPQAPGVGLRPAAPRTASGPTLVQLDAQAFRCPYCGSTDTRLENLFGPDPVPLDPLLPRAAGSRSSSSRRSSSRRDPRAAPALDRPRGHAGPLVSQGDSNSA